VTWVHIQIGNDFDEYYLKQHAKQKQFYVMSCVWSYFCYDIIVFLFMFTFIFRFVMCVYFIVNVFDSQRRQHTHTTPTHVNRQTDKECAWGRPRLLQTVFKMLFFRSFVTCHERGTAWLFHVRASQNYCASHLSSRRSDGGLAMQVSCLKDKPNMREGAKGDTPEVVGRYCSIIRIYTLWTSSTLCRVLGLT